MVKTSTTEMMALKLEQQAIEVKAIGGVYLPASNIMASAQWYNHCLGLAWIRPVSEDSTQAQLRIGCQTLYLIQTKESSNLTYYEVGGNEQCVLTLEYADVKQLHNHMQSAGADITEIWDNGPCGLTFHAKDPDGNKIELWGGWVTEEATP